MVEGSCKMKDAIGGYFSLELSQLEEYHKKAIKLNTGRNCLEYILRCRQYKKVYIPYYTCEVILEPFKKLGIEYSCYHINEKFELSEEIYLQEGEALLYTNYFALKQNYIGTLVFKYGNKLIVDNTQAFYAKPFFGIDTFYTCRKFFGVADGAYLYIDKIANFQLEQDISYNKMMHLLKRIDLSPEEGFADFHINDDSLIDNPIRRMSKLTQRIMQSIDYEKIAKKRQNNFHLLHKYLSKTNKLSLQIGQDAVPMAYPYYVHDIGLRKNLIASKVFVAQYWSNVLDWCDKDSIEGQLANNLLALPIDQRYDEKKMMDIINIIQKNA